MTNSFKLQHYFIPKPFILTFLFQLFFLGCGTQRGVFLTSFPYFVSCQPWRILPLSLVTISCTNIYTLWLSNFSILSCDGGASRSKPSHWKKKVDIVLLFYLFLHSIYYLGPFYCLQFTEIHLTLNLFWALAVCMQISTRINSAELTFLACPVSDVAAQLGQLKYRQKHMREGRFSWKMLFAS